ncbi:MAG: hypothetical protein L0154_15500 [Chloroflexi bacterium]|nr:hypothetical protein [Chloroflexota bacterium]
MSDDQKIRDGRHDFDFYTGTWKVHNRRLKERLKGCQEWEEFEGISVAQPILGGVGNFDTITMYRDSGIHHGVTLRLFNLETHEWHLHWADSVSGALVPPMIGKFEDGIGHFYSHELFAGRHILCRFIWSGISETTCRWEQAFSEDGGATWETNWIMESVK